MNRTLAVLASALLTLSAPIAGSPSQSMPDMPGMRGMKMATGVKVAVSDDAAGHVLTVRLGPWNLAAHAGMDVPQAPDLRWTVPFDGWFTAYHPRLTDAGGQSLPSRLLHHVAVYDTNQRNFLCPRQPEHIFGAGGEMTDWPTLPGLGYKVRRGDGIRFSTMVHNDEDTAFPEAYLEIKIEYQLLVQGGSNLAPVRPVWFDVKECGDSGYDLDPGRNVKAGVFTLETSGKLLGVGGHLHDYGRELTLENETTQKLIAKIDATLDEQGHLLAVPIVRFTATGGYDLAKGDRIKVTALYDNPTGKHLPDSAMGIMVGYFLPEGPGDVYSKMSKLRQGKPQK